MKTPERWGPLASCPPCQYSCPKMSNDVMLWRRMTWQRETAQVKPSENHIFQPSDLDFWPANTYERFLRSTPLPNFFLFWVHTSNINSSGGRALIVRHTDIYTDGTNFIPWPLTWEGSSRHGKVEVLKLSDLSVLSDMDTWGPILTLFCRPKCPREPKNI